MKKDSTLSLMQEYQIGCTKYKVSPVFPALADKESLADKIRRLILSDKENNRPRT